MTLIRTLSNLGYGSRREVERMIKRGRVTNADGERLRTTDKPAMDGIRVDGQPLDPGPPLLVMLHKPTDVVCTRADDEGPTVYGLLPPRFGQRKPPLATVGRLDKDTTGLLLLTDDGPLLHRLTSPRHAAEKRYRVQLDRPVEPDQVALIESGRLRLRNEETPLRAARVQTLDPHTVLTTVTEGRYHLVRRMWAAVGNHVVALHREAQDGLELGDLPLGAWRVVDPSELATSHT